MPSEEHALAGRLTTALNDGPAEVCAILWDEAHRQGVNAVAKRAGMHRNSLAAALKTHGNPTLGLLRQIVGAYGLEICFAPKKAEP